MSNKILSCLSPWKGVALIGSTALLLSACGDEITEVTEVNEVGMKVIEKGEALPKCSSDNEGAMIYAVDSAAAYFCVNRKWTSMKGEKGDQGEPGKDGKQGKQGEQGDAGSSCTMEALLDSSGFKVLCGGDSVGVVLNGATGEKGDAGDSGDKGDKGADGVGCSVTDDGEGTITINCGEGKDTTTAVFHKAMCKSVPYDPDNHFCDSRDGHIYRYVTIGTQTWMAQNMNYKTTYSRCYNFDKTNCETDGSLYLIRDSLEVCPAGWHLPDTSEYRILIKTAGGDASAGKMLKSSNGWQTEDGNGIDTYGFSIIPAGKFFMSPNGESSSGKNSKAYLWTRSQGKNDDYEYVNHYSLQLSSDSDSAIIVRETGEGKTHSCYMSVRCIKD